MVANDLWELYATGFVDTTDPTQYVALANNQKNQLRETRRKDAKALSLIKATLTKAIFLRIAATNYAKEVWEILQMSYKRIDKVRLAKLQMLRRDFETLQMKDSESISKFHTRVSGLLNQLRSNGETMEEHRIVEKILQIFPSKFDAIMIVIEEAKDLSILTVDELMVSLQTHEQCLNRSSTSSQEQAFKAQDNTRDRGRGRNGGRSSRGRGCGNEDGFGQANSQEGVSNSQNNSKQGKKNSSSNQRYETSNVECFNYHKFGHYARDYRKKQGN
ncbi:uncharacterized protein LOC131058126 [Cryptomeria japonica]|uniref:uncharacterized protein LOC131058126 n=1 Tax=Cryptomeria japonica TaxID=3369 RepID=UPI0027D9EDE8|nr:uncharacterized protein LOC131058126 [Cryptomeria japonica]